MPAGSKQPIVVHYVEHMPPDVTAGIFLLKNRDPENWRDVQNVDHVLGKYIISDRRVERSLYARANGYSYDAVKVFMPAGAKQPVIVHYTEHCPPDVGAAFIWLKNRDPDRWRDVHNVEHVLGKYLISDHPMTVEQWAAERATVVNEVIDDLPRELPAPESKQR
jgi:hypothetical protein